MPGDGCGRKTVTPAGFNHPGCAEELGGTSRGGRQQCWKQGDSPRLEVLWECVWRALGRRADAGHSDCREELISNPNPLLPRNLCNRTSLGRGAKSAPHQPSKLFWSFGESQTFWTK